jgi:hypothetical protein
VELVHGSGRPGPRGRPMGSRHSETIPAVDSVMRGCDFMHAKGYFTSNLEHGSYDGPLGFMELTIQSSASMNHMN